MCRLKDWVIGLVRDMAYGLKEFKEYWARKGVKFIPSFVKS